MIHVELDAKELERLADEVGATQKQVQMAFSRALTRTAATLRRMSSKGLKDELQLRNVKRLRRRLKTIRLRRGTLGARLWYGLNPMPISDFKGRAQETRGGAQFREHKYSGGFVAKGQRGKRTVFRRVKASRLPIAEETVLVQDQMNVFIEDEIFEKTDRIFYKHFENDLRARAIHGVGGRR